MMQIFVSDKGFVKVYGMKYEKYFVKALKLFFKEVGASKTFIVDPHPYQKRNEVRKFLKKMVKNFEPWRNQPSTLIEMSCTLD